MLDPADPKNDQNPRFSRGHKSTRSRGRPNSEQDKLREIQASSHHNQTSENGDKRKSARENGREEQVSRWILVRLYEGREEAAA